MYAYIYIYTYIHMFETSVFELAQMYIFNYARFSFFLFYNGESFVLPRDRLFYMISVLVHTLVRIIFIKVILGSLYSRIKNFNR